MTRREYFEKKDCQAIISVSDTEADIKFAYLKHILGDLNNKDILVLGCGNGIIEKRLIEYFKVKSITLVDASSELLEQAKSVCAPADCFNIDFTEMSKNTLNKRYDIIYSFDVMQYLIPSEIKKLQMVLMHYLKRNGYIYHLGVPEKKRRILCKMDRCLSHNSIKHFFDFDFIDSYSRWVRKKEFTSLKYNTLFLTPSLRFERFDVVISKKS